MARSTIYDKVMFAAKNDVTLHQIVRFCVVGVITTAVYLTASLLLKGHLGVPLTTAATYSFVVVAPTAYVLHHSWTFRSARPHSSAFPRFVLTATGGILLNSSVVALGVQSRVAPHSLVLLLGIASVVVWNYVLSRFWVFVDTVRQR